MPDTSSRRLAMNAIVQDEFGPPEVLELRDMPEPVVGDSDVLVNVRAAGCGPDVWHIMTGKPYLVRVMPEVRKQMRGIRGWDVAGIVETVGANVSAFGPGDEVMGAIDGSLAELAIGPRTRSCVSRRGSVSSKQPPCRSRATPRCRLSARRMCSRGRRCS